MLALNKVLNDELNYKGQKYSLDLSFNNVLDALEVIELNELDFDDRIAIAIELITGVELSDDPFEQLQIWEYLVSEFLFEDKPAETVYDRQGNPMPKENGEGAQQAISYFHDADYIYSAFYQVYKIDLLEVQYKLHWSKFNALLNGLPDETQIKKIINIRLSDLNQIKDKSEKEQMKKLKKHFALPSQNSEEGE